MDTQTFTLFVACLLFSGFSFYWNMKSTGTIVRLATLTWGMIGIIAALVVLSHSISTYFR